jgi:hypothetical protein
LYLRRLAAIDAQIQRLQGDGHDGKNAGRVGENPHRVEISEQSVMASVRKKSFCPVTALMSL